MHTSELGHFDIPRDLETIPVDAKNRIGKEIVMKMYSTVQYSIARLNTIPIDKRLMPPNPDYVPLAAKRRYEKKNGKGVVTTFLELRLGTQNSSENGRYLKDGIDGYTLTISTVPMFLNERDQYTQSYRLSHRFVIQQIGKRIHISIGKNNYAGMEMNYDTEIELVLSEDGMITLGKKTIPDEIFDADGKPFDLTPVIDVVIDIIPHLVEGAVLDFSMNKIQRFFSGLPQTIQFALQSLEDMYDTSKQ